MADACSSAGGGGREGAGGSGARTPELARTLSASGPRGFELGARSSTLFRTSGRMRDVMPWAVPLGSLFRRVCRSPCFSLLAAALSFLSGQGTETSGVFPFSFLLYVCVYVWRGGSTSCRARYRFRETLLFYGIPVSVRHLLKVFVPNVVYLCVKLVMERLANRR